MSESPQNHHEQLRPDLNLEPINIEQLTEIIDESMHAFLAPASNPEQTTDELFAAFQKDPKFQLYSYVVDGHSVSYVAALSGKDPQTIAIGPMYVAKQYQGQGLGRRQVEDFLSLAKQAGYEKVFTKTWLENASSRSIFESLGFLEVGIDSYDRANGDSTIKYLRRL